MQHASERNPADLAKRLDVTHMTVSRALNGTGNLSTATRKKVQTLARKLGYQPNGMARWVQEGRCQTSWCSERH